MSYTGNSYINKKLYTLTKSDNGKIIYFDHAVEQVTLDAEQFMGNALLYFLNPPANGVSVFAEYGQGSGVMVIKGTVGGKTFDGTRAIRTKTPNAFLQIAPNWDGAAYRILFGGGSWTNDDATKLGAYESAKGTVTAFSIIGGIALLVIIVIVVLHFAGKKQRRLF